MCSEAEVVNLKKRLDFIKRGPNLQWLTARLVPPSEMRERRQEFGGLVDLIIIVCIFSFGVDYV